jgi:hypothetical protein
MVNKPLRRGYPAVVGPLDNAAWGRSLHRRMQRIETQHKNNLMMQLGAEAVMHRQRG